LIEGNWLDEATRRRRKSYALTDAGHRHLAARVEAWLDFFNRFLSILEEGVP
jgi:DNA-binding PadR family transcriptional regulator